MKRLVTSYAIVVAVSIPAAMLWMWWQKPGEWTIDNGSIYMDEVQSAHQFSVVMGYVIIGAVLGFVIGWWLDRRHPDAGWWSAPIVLLAAGLAAALVASIAYFFGPPDPTTLKHLTVGDSVFDQYIVDSVAPYAVWLAAASLGLLSSLMLRLDSPGPE